MNSAKQFKADAQQAKAVGHLQWIERLCLLQNSYVGTLTPKAMVSGGGAFEKWLGHEGGVLMNGISALLDETPESSFIPFIPWGPSKKTAVSEPGSTLPSETKAGKHYDLGLPAPRTVRNKFLLFVDTQSMVIC